MQIQFTPKPPTETPEEGANRLKIGRQRLRDSIKMFEEAIENEYTRQVELRGLIGGGQFDDEALRQNIKDADRNVTMFEDKIEKTHTEIKDLSHMIRVLQEQADVGTE